MPYKDPEKRKSYLKIKSAEHYEANKERIKLKTAATKKAGRAKWAEFKTGLHCWKCKQCHPATLDFHHVNPQEKEYNVHMLISSGMFTKAYEEIKKCVVLCANCHPIHHYDERMELKKAKKRKKSP